MLMIETAVDPPGPAHQTCRSQTETGFRELAMPSDFFRNLVEGEEGRSEGRPSSHAAFTSPNDFGDLSAEHSRVTTDGGGWIGELRFIPILIPFSFQ